MQLARGRGSHRRRAGARGASGEREASARDRAYVVADVSKIRDQLGWKPRLGLEEGIRLTIEAKVHELKKKSA
jgi:nucleoside-diphosphate-sugar epimerase